jgi:O-antigen ligase
MVAVAVIIAALLAATWLAMWRPIAGVFLWIALFPVQLDTFQRLGFRLAPADVVLAGLVAATILRKLFLRQGWAKVDGAFRAALLLLVWLILATLSTLLSLGHIPSYVLVNKLLGLTLLVASYWLVLETIRSRELVERSLEVFCWLGSAWNVVGLAAYGCWKYAGVLSPFIFYPRGEDRLTGLLVDPNAYGGFLAVVLLIQLTLVAANRSKIPAWVWAPNTALLFLGLALTYSRSAWLASLCGAVALVLHLARRERTRLFGFALAALLVVLPVFLLASRTSISEIWSLASRTPQITTRFSLVLDALRSFSSSPVWGIGVGVFTTLPVSHGLIIHSTYFWLLAETGIVGLLLMGWFLVRVYLEARVSYKGGGPRSRWIVLAGIASLATWLGFMVGIEGLYQRHFWFLCATIGAYYLAEREQRGDVGKLT